MHARLISIVWVAATSFVFQSQGATAQDALWAWDSINLRVCSDALSSASISTCFNGLVDVLSDYTQLMATDGVNVYTATVGGGLGYRCPIDGYGANCIQIAVGPYSVTLRPKMTCLAVGGVHPVDVLQHQTTVLFPLFPTLVQ